MKRTTASRDAGNCWVPTCSQRHWSLPALRLHARRSMTASRPSDGLIWTVSRTFPDLGFALDGQPVIAVATFPVDGASVEPGVGSTGGAVGALSALFGVTSGEGAETVPAPAEFSAATRKA